MLRKLRLEEAGASYDTSALIAFLTDLHKELRGQSIILIWAGLPAHRSRAMAQHLQTQRRRLQVERLPGL